MAVRTLQITRTRYWKTPVTPGRRFPPALTIANLTDNTKNLNEMKPVKIMLTLVLALSLGACGDMGNNTNEDHSQYIDSSGVNADNSGNPNSTDAPMRNTYDTDSMTSTSGPVNAAPKSSSLDSTVSTQPRR